MLLQIGHWENKIFMAYGITSAESGVSKKNRVHIEYVLV